MRRGKLGNVIKSATKQAQVSKMSEIEYEILRITDEAGAKIEKLNSEYGSEMDKLLFFLSKSDKKVRDQVFKEVAEAKLDLGGKITSYKYDVFFRLVGADKEIDLDSPRSSKYILHRS